MMRLNEIQTTRLAAGFTAVVALTIWAITSALPAQAADPTFPVGSRLGLVPPPGMVPSKNFEGFEDPGNNAAILLAEFPSIAYAQLDKSMVPAELKKQGVDVEKREPIDFGFGKGFLLTGKQATNNAHYRKWLLIAGASDLTALVTVQVPDPGTAYPDQAIRDALKTLTVRASVPDTERLSLLPFTVGDLAGLHIEDVLPGRALMLIDKAAAAPATGAKTPDVAAAPLNARMFIAAVPGGPEAASDQNNFARVLFDQIGGIKEVHIQDAEPLRIEGQAGYQTLAQAKDVKTDADVMVVQWLRFGGGGYLQMIAIARTDGWTDMLTRLRTVRDSVDTK